MIWMELFIMVDPPLESQRLKRRSIVFFLSVLKKLRVSVPPGKQCGRTLLTVVHIKCHCHDESLTYLAYIRAEPNWISLSVEKVRTKGKEPFTNHLFSSFSLMYRFLQESFRLCINCCAVNWYAADVAFLYWGYYKEATDTDSSDLSWLILSQTNIRIIWSWQLSWWDCPHQENDAFIIIHSRLDSCLGRYAYVP